MQVRIHRGAHEIGGNCIEVAAGNGERIVLDVGRPLSAGWNDDPALPEVPGFDGDDPSLLAVVISHPHLDHYGLVGKIPESVPIYMGEEATSILAAAEFFSPITTAVKPKGFLAHRKPFTIGPFEITPFLNDHSAFDAYSLLIEADGRRVFYTGDFRAHGRKAGLFESFVSKPPKDVDVLMMEGTHVRPGGAHDEATFETETDLEERFVKLCGETAGAVVTFGSMQNLDRLVTVFRAAKRSNRELVVDLYGATVAAASRSTIPQPGFDGLRVYVRQRERVTVKKSKEFWRVGDISAHRVYSEELAEHPERFVFHVPSSTARELIDDSALTEDGIAVWSLWEGYRTTPSGLSLQALLDEHKITMVSIHTSGHASVTDLKRLVEAIEPGRVVPIHSESTERFAELFPRVEQHADGTWWNV